MAGTEAGGKKPPQQFSKPEASTVKIGRVDRGQGAIKTGFTQSGQLGCGQNQQKKRRP